MRPWPVSYARLKQDICRQNQRAAAAPSKTYQTGAAAHSPIPIPASIYSPVCITASLNNVGICMERLPHSSWMVLDNTGETGRKIGGYIEKEWRRDEGTNKTKRKNPKKLNLQRDDLRESARIRSCLYRSVKPWPSASHHSHPSCRKRDMLRSNSPGYSCTPFEGKMNSTKKCGGAFGITCNCLNVRRT